MTSIFIEKMGVLKPNHLRDMLGAPKSHVMVMTALIENPIIFYGVMGLTTYQAMLENFIAGRGVLDFAGSLEGGRPLTLNCNVRTDIEGYNSSSVADKRMFDVLMYMLDDSGLGTNNLNASGTSER